LIIIISGEHRSRPTPLSYGLNDQNLFDTEYACHVMDISVDLTAKPEISKPALPVDSVRAQAAKGWMMKLFELHPSLVRGTGTTNQEPRERAAV